MAGWNFRWRKMQTVADDIKTLCPAMTKDGLISDFFLHCFKSPKKRCLIARLSIFSSDRLCSIVLWRVICFLFLEIYARLSHISVFWFLVFYSRLRNKRRGTLINFWKILKKKKIQKWSQCLDLYKKVLKSWCENF